MRACQSSVHRRDYLLTVATYPQVKLRHYRPRNSAPQPIVTYLLPQSWDEYYWICKGREPDPRRVVPRTCENVGGTERADAALLL